MEFLHNMEWVLPLRSDAATAIANGFTWLGYTTFFLIALPLAYWFWGRDRAMRMTVLIAITAILNGWLKDLWQDPRPNPKYWLDQRVLGSYGRPSGHAQVAFAMWSLIAWEIRQYWAYAAAAIIITGVCFSRLYLGVHDVDDVLTGVGLAIIGLAIFAWLLSPKLEAAHNWPMLTHLAIIVVAGAVLFITWPNGEKPDSTVGVLALLFGWVLGANMDRKLAPAEPVLPVWWLCVPMGLIGLVILFALQSGLNHAAHALGADGTVARYAINAALAFYMTGLAPLAFRKLGLVR
ncbi:phosphatase PAP2 family protein [Parvibaculum sedimenti]|uniref:Phosphatase PAP2 family protein n=1 Tax=Parvibaculum sedimenti TaxID=2608632 RepID=A0A6N6VMI8_9HYPH|nr:phosphatase PAP2 family protein [Parvibaculum sedimenti]KAB7740232.1 phosphatase PAP2 family protein [Parvibaculum sedimenti]